MVAADNSRFEKMASKVPLYRVPLNSKLQVQRASIASYITLCAAGLVGFALFNSTKIYNPYSYYPVIKQYRAQPDFATNSVTFSEKTKQNTLNDF